MTRTFQDLIKKEGSRSLGKGMLASITSWVTSSIIMIAAYETVKKLSLNKDAIHLFTQKSPVFICGLRQGISRAEMCQLYHSSLCWGESAATRRLQYDRRIQSTRLSRQLNRSSQADNTVKRQHVTTTFYPPITFFVLLVGGLVGSFTKTNGERPRLSFKIACKMRSFIITTQCRTFSTRELHEKIVTVPLNTVIGLQNKQSKVKREA